MDRWRNGEMGGKIDGRRNGGIKGWTEHPWMDGRIDR